MKKLTALILALALVMSLVTLSHAEDRQYKVGLVLLVENGAFLDMKSGIISGLEKAGYVE